MNIQPIVQLPAPVKLSLTLGRYPRPRVVDPKADTIPASEVEFTSFPMTVRVDAHAQTVTAYLSPMHRGLTLYGPADYSAAAGDTMDDLAARVLQILGSDPASILQALIDGDEIPLPARVPREIANWRCKAVLSAMGLLDEVEAVLSTLPDEVRTIALLAWNGDAKVMRTSSTVAVIAAALNLSETQMDDLFIQAESIQV